MADHWNQLIKIRDTAVKKLRSEPDNESLQEIAERSIMFLKQLNTAGGAMIKPEIESFIAGLAKNNFL